MVLTRSQARSRQSLDRVASSGASPPRRVSSTTSETLQQSSSEEGVVGNSVVNTGSFGGRSVTAAVESGRPKTVRKCRSDCLTCPSLIKSSHVISNETNKIYNVINVDSAYVHCKLQNYVYVLQCSSCGVQYVGESVIPVNLRMNIHRRGKSGCEVAIDHFKNVCPGATFSIQILENLPGNGYKNGVVDSEMLKRRLQREDHWIKTLRTVYPYGLNERTKSMNSNVPTGQLFPPLPRHGTKFINKRSRSTMNSNISDLDSWIQNTFSFEKESRSNNARILLNKLKLSNLKKLAQEANSLLSTCAEHLKRWYDLLIDVYLSKVYKTTTAAPKKAPKHIFSIFFHNKGLEFINLKKILRHPDVISKLPEHLQEQEPPSIVYKLSSTISNKIFNYKQTVHAIDIHDEITYGTELPECDCRNSPFVDTDHGHIVTGDLRIIANKHLRKLLSKGPNYREPKSINWSKCKEEILNALENCGDSLARKFNLDCDDMRSWKDEILKQVDTKISYLKRKVKHQKVNPVLSRPEVISYLETLHSKFVLVPIDKAANNVSVICKRFYVEVILKEIGILGEGNKTYVKTTSSQDEIVEINVEYSQRLNLKVSENEHTLPYMYWTPKKHKTPTGKRFIIASKNCSTKKISSAVSQAFKLIYNQIENFHKKAKFLSNYNKFWVLQNCNPILEIISKINKKENAKCISTFDFSTLYTKLPHDKLVKELSDVITFVFDHGGSSSYITVPSNGKAYWSKKKSKSSISFSKNSLKQAVKHLIENCYFTVGDVVMSQVIGIPMGIDPAPFWANLFLYQYEHRYIENLIKEDKVKARYFHSTKRFIDDLCALNDGNLFERMYRDIYPEELELKMEHSGNHATFLNLDITIVNRQFVYKLYDKRDAFPFSIVRMPHLDSNIPETIFYSALVGEFLRIARSTLLVSDFIVKASALCQRMLKQGADQNRIKHNLRKIISRHAAEFSRFRLPTDVLIHKLLNEVA